MPIDLEPVVEEPIDDEIRAMLRTYEGPVTPIRRPVAHALRREVLLKRLAIAGLCVLGVLVGAGVYAIGSSSENSTGAECPERLVVGDVPYLGNALLPGETLTPGAALGAATVPGCSDELAEPASDARSVEVSRIVGVSPGVAVVRPDQPDLVYVADGRCSGVQDLLGCLRESLTFRGTRYAPTFLNPETSAPPGLGRALGEGTLTSGDGETKPVTIARIKGVAPSVAVAVPGQARFVYVADGRCYLAQTARFLSCLRGSD